MKTYSVDGCRAVIFRPGMPLKNWVAQNQTDDLVAVCNASLYENASTPCGTVIENGNLVHNAGSGFGFGVTWVGDAAFGAPWEYSFRDYLTGYNGCVQGGKYVAPTWTDRYVFPCRLARIGIGSRGGKHTICTDDGVTLQGFAEDAISAGFETLVNLDGGGSRFLWYKGKTIYTSSRTPYNAIAFYKDGGASEPEEEKENNMKIYLSPSSQPANLYAAGDTNEQAQCNRIAEFCKVALERCGFDVKKGPEGQHYKDNVADSNAWGAEVHIPIHTNAASGKARGARVFVYGLTEKRLKYATPVLEALNETVPVIGSRAVTAAANLYECAYTKGLCVYCECAFHDRADEAQWIIDHAQELGEAICKGVCKGTGVEYIQPSGAAAEEKPEGYDAWLACKKYFDAHGE